MSCIAKPPLAVCSSPACFPAFVPQAPQTQLSGRHFVCLLLLHLTPHCKTVHCPMGCQLLLLLHRGVASQRGCHGLQTARRRAPPRHRRQLLGDIHLWTASACCATLAAVLLRHGLYCLCARRAPHEWRRLHAATVLVRNQLMQGSYRPPLTHAVDAENHSRADKLCACNLRQYTIILYSRTLFRQECISCHCSFERPHELIAAASRRPHGAPGRSGDSGESSNMRRRLTAPELALLARRVRPAPWGLSAGSSLSSSAEARLGLLTRRCCLRCTPIGTAKFVKTCCCSQQVCRIIFVANELQSRSDQCGFKLPNGYLSRAPLRASQPANAMLCRYLR